MPHSSVDIRRLTHALLHTDTAPAAVEALHGCQERPAIEGLVEAILAPPSAGVAVAALAALDGCDDACALHARTAALASPHPSVRLAAIASMHRSHPRAMADGVVRCLGRDPSWLVRRAALELVADQAGPERWQVLLADDDPHWRVRHALVKVLMRWGESPGAHDEIATRLAQAAPQPRLQGIACYLRYRWDGGMDTSIPSPAPPLHERRYWDSDAAVLARNLERMTDAQRRAALDDMPVLLGHTDHRVRKIADTALRRWGTVSHLAAVVTLLAEPRTEAFATIAMLLDQLDLDRTEELVRLVLGQDNASPAALAWALGRAVAAFPDEETAATLLRYAASASTRDVGVRRALVCAAAGWNDVRSAAMLRPFLDDADPEVQYAALRGLAGDADLRRFLHSPAAAVRAEAIQWLAAQGADLQESVLDDPAVEVRLALARGLVQRSDHPWLERLQADPHPHVRAASLTPARAALLVEHPEVETSWHVLAGAARLARVPFWKLAPEPAWQPSITAATDTEQWQPARVECSPRRLLGPGQIAVAPLGVSGHYGLPVEGFRRAVEASVNLLFWEPNYETLWRFVGRLSPRDRSALHIVTGTFEADGVRIRRDAERALRLLQIDRIALFLLFWVQSWKRLTPDVIAALQQLKDAGKVGLVGLSTHSRPLAVEAIDRGWNPVMVRHSVAHRGAEQHVFPHAAAKGVGVITFNNTCYGRLLRAVGNVPAPTAADCYRYTLAQPAVTACFSAPATVAELDENLQALRDPHLPAERLAELRLHGDRVYREDRVFSRCVRNL